MSILLSHCPAHRDAHSPSHASSYFPSLLLHDGPSHLYLPELLPPDPINRPDPDSEVHERQREHEQACEEDVGPAEAHPLEHELDHGDEHGTQRAAYEVVLFLE